MNIFIADKRRQNVSMKVLHIGKYYPPFSGGIENFMGDLLPLLSSPKTQICALVHDHSAGKLAQKETVNNIRIIRVPSYGRLLYAPISPAFPFYLYQTLKQFQPDIIHIHMPNTSAFWVLFSSRAKKIPWVIHWHSDVIGSAPNKLVAFAYHFYQLFERRLLKRSRKIIATSPNYLHSSSVLKPWKDKTQIIPLGLPEQQVILSSQAKQQAEQLWGRSNNRLLAIGRLTYYKGH
ncbi:MAG: glycosyltransferase, partial [Thiotrichaceae bacterium]|nr:glycosyltransferase [Thiotrichaceae bacterium]